MTFAYLCCMSSNLGTIPLKLLPISTEHGEMGIQVIEQYEGASRNSIVWIRALKIKKAEDGYGSLDNEQLQAVVTKLLSKIHDKAPKKISEILAVSTATASLAGYWKGVSNISLALLS